MVPKQRKANSMIKVTKLPARRSVLRTVVAVMVADYIAKGGKVTVCKPAHARGAR